MLKGFYEDGTEIVEGQTDRENELQSLADYVYAYCNKILLSGENSFETENMAKDLLSKYWEVHGG